jgi:hypothetical protein
LETNNWDRQAGLNMESFFTEAETMELYRQN